MPSENCFIHYVVPCHKNLRFFASTTCKIDNTNFNSNFPPKLTFSNKINGTLRKACFKSFRMNTRSTMFGAQGAEKTQT